MRNNNLLLREKRHTTACMRYVRESSKKILATSFTLKTLHHAQMAHLAHRARKEYTRRPREAT